jgi:hypothetical protein
MNKNRSRKRKIQRKRNKNNKTKTKPKMHAKRKYTKKHFLSVKVPDSVTTVTLFQKTQGPKNELKNIHHKDEGNLIVGMRKFLSKKIDL